MFFKLGYYNSAGGVAGVLFKFFGVNEFKKIGIHLDEESHQEEHI